MNTLLYIARRRGLVDFAVCEAKDFFRAEREILLRAVGLAVVFRISDFEIVKARDPYQYIDGKVRAAMDKLLQMKGRIDASWNFVGEWS